MEFSSSLQHSIDLEDTCINFNFSKSSNVNRLKSAFVLSNEEEKKLMSKSVITPGFERKHEIPPYLESKRQRLKKRREERKNDKGKGWFNMKAPEMTEEAENDLTVIQMRRALDPKQFYKNNDSTVLPKFYHRGTVVETAADFYSGRIPKKERKKTIVDELLDDLNFQKYQKRKYTEIKLRESAMKRRRGAQRHSNRVKKRKSGRT